MSIKTIDTGSVGTDTGISKKINKGAEKLVFDILQSTQYSTPIPSTVRELVTNACDSQREKEIAVEILTDVKKIEDYYIERHGEQYEDSNFNREYYDLDSFSSNDRVLITYKKNDGVGFCDLFSITDYGVGIGGKRLEGVLELGYSTKRNTSQNFGAFGLGAKVALSTGVEFYTIETIYQGKRFKVNCYSYKTEFVIPKFNVSTGGINPSYTLSDGSVIYYEPTTEKNCTTVSFGVKKHNFSRFKDSVSEQLTYFDNIDFKVINEDGVEDQVYFKTPIIYNSDTLIVSESYYFNKPHIVIVKDVKSNNGINYGHIDFKELEMEQLYGAIGLKCPIRQSYVDENGDTIIIQDGVEVTPSREKVIWNDATKEYIQKVISKASDEVTEIVESELKETDFIKWLVACKDVLYNTTRSQKVDASKRTVLSVLSNILDTTALKPKYELNPKIKFSTIGQLFYGFKVVKKTINTSLAGASKSISVIGTDLEGWEKFDGNKVYLAEDNISRLKDYHLITQCEGDFILIYPKNLENILEKINDGDTQEIDKLAYIQEYKKCLANQELLLPLLKASALCNNYDTVEVPEGVSLALTQAEEMTENDFRILGLNETPEERRLRNSAIVVHAIRQDNDYRGTIVWDKVEPILNDVILSKTPTYYGSAEDSDLLMPAFNLMRKDYKRPGYFYDNYISSYTDHLKISYWDSLSVSTLKGTSTHTITKKSNNGEPVSINTPQIIKVAQQNVKHIALNPNAKPIGQFYYDVKDDGTLTAHKIIKIVVTIALLKKSINLDYSNYQHDRTLSILSEISPAFETFEKIVDRCIGFHANNIPAEYMQMYERWASFQKASKRVEGDELEELASSLCIFSDIKSVDIYNEELLEALTYLHEIVQMCDPLLSNINFLNEADLLREIELYLTVKGVYDVPLPGGCSTLTELNSHILQTLLTSLQ